MRPRWEKKVGPGDPIGRWIFVLQFRRAAMGTLSRCWEAVEAHWPHFGQVNRAHEEVLAVMLIQTDLETDYDLTITCSDGAAAMSQGLTWSGRSLATVWDA